MRWTIWILVPLLVAVAISSGCGSSSPTMEEMKRRAIRRTPEDDEEEERDAQESTPAASPAATGDPAGDPAASSGERTGAAGGDRAATGPASTTPPPTDGQKGPSTAQAGGPTVPTGNGQLPKSTTRQPPPQPLSPDQRLELSRQNLKQIGTAVSAYVTQHGNLPAPAIVPSGSRSGTLSWRVELLPYLGLQELYDAFRLDQPWDSPHNARLVALIPAVYQSPERFDDRTNYLAVVGGSAAFNGKYGVNVKRIEDGLDNTAILVEADDALAVPWTKPQELEVDLRAPSQGLGEVREKGFLALAGNGIPVWVPLPVENGLLKSAFTRDSGESTGLLDLAGSLELEAGDEQTPSSPSSPSSSGSSGSVAAVDGSRAAGSPPSPEVAPRTVAASNDGSPAPSSSTGDSRGFIQSTDEPLPVPDGDSLRRARALFREIYQDEYADAQEKADKKKFAQKLMEDLPKVRAHPASHYVLLEIIREIAVQGEDLETAVAVVDELCQSYDVKSHDIRAKVVGAFVSLGRGDNRRRSDKKLMQIALRYAKDALLAEQFKDAEELCQLAIGAVQGDKDDELLDRLATRRDMITDFKRAHSDAEDAMKSLDKNPDDGPAKVALGRYLCFYKGDWENGLPVLADGSSGSLRQVVDLELANPATPEGMVVVGDAWWDRAASATAAEMIAMRRRAVTWYQRALPNLAGGLQRIKTQRRIEEFEEEEEARQALISESR